MLLISNFENRPREMLGNDISCCFSEGMRGGRGECLKARRTLTMCEAERHILWGGVRKGPLGGRQAVKEEEKEEEEENKDKEENQQEEDEEDDV